MPMFIIADHVVLSVTLLAAFTIFATFILEYRMAPTELTVILILFSLAIQFFTTTDLIGYITHNPIDIIIGSVVYLLIGVVYVWIKWYSFVHAAARKYRDWMIENSSSYTSIESSNSAAARSLGYKFLPLKVSNYKQLIFGWMFYWPLSAAWTLLNDPIARLFNFIYHRIAGSLQKISDNAFNEK